MFRKEEAPSGNINERQVFAENRFKFIKQVGEKLKRRSQVEKMDEGDFVAKYGEEEVARDKAEIEATRRNFYSNFDEESRRIKACGDTLEQIIAQNIKENRWFGDNTKVKFTSRYDDIKNGVDFVLEIRREGQPAFSAMCIDATFGVPDYKKLGRLQYEIDSGQLAKLKYSNLPENTDSAGDKSDKGIPRLILSLDLESLAQLSALEDKVIGTDKQKTDKAQEELSAHPAQVIFLRQIIEQLKVYAEYARSRGGEKAKSVIKPLQELQKIAEDIFQDKLRSGKFIGKISDDLATAKLMSGLQTIFGKKPRALH